MVPSDHWSRASIGALRIGELLQLANRVNDFHALPYRYECSSSGNLLSATSSA